jgi:hypothetical protein
MKDFSARLFSQTQGMPAGWARLNETRETSLATDHDGASKRRKDAKSASERHHDKTTLT